MTTLRLAVGLAMLAAFGNVASQDAAEPYHPLFTPEMIEKASPDQAARMRATEERNRQAWDERQEALRKQAQQAPQPDQPAPPPRARTKAKVFKWVDKDGRVHFGDAPAGTGAKEIEVKGIARVQGKPPPPPGSTGGEKD